MAVAENLREQVFKRAAYRCEYCQAPEVVGVTLTIDHIEPQSKGGSDEVDNLCAACDRCNNRKSDYQTALDPETAQQVPLFNPREDSWNEHFRWDTAGLILLGLTPCGRATIIQLKLNHEKQQLRRFYWMKLGLHPIE